MMSDKLEAVRCRVPPVVALRKKESKSENDIGTSLVEMHFGH
jgi:hypothetical protein